MAGAVQVLTLSDDEDNLSCACNNPHSQTLPQSRPRIRPTSPGILKFCVILKWLVVLNYPLL